MWPQFSLGCLQGKPTQRSMFPGRYVTLFAHRPLAKPNNATYQRASMLKPYHPKIYSAVPDLQQLRALIRGIWH